ncbi:hypothetical protein KFE25_002567 [Diacronema lutheri]|uniref:PPM-type phosphatase domain-containing protein n=1 Tax=Diacronema lutheri TaxID=2081491 RepID=A0A7R9YNV0_DIALT|nr:hypothetical protein KFE25_002567 [Diacronema lutheri]|mmetsp:Transcript_6304/g.19762  ORF Transcript_6304/g.19762 Transcript_6304/m.19762 type:complete len:374 (+) Transcript_6304:89-1210(+)
MSAAGSAPPPLPSKESASEQSFRRRRLSVADLDTSEFDDEPADEKSPNGTDSKRRIRRMSMSPEMGVVRKKSDLPFPLEIVGTYSCHGVEPGMRHGETSAKINQDRGAVCYPFADSDEIAMFSVFDGHGVCGDKVSHFAMNTLQAILEDHPLLTDKPAQALKHSYLQCDSLLKQEPTIDAELSGTTAVVTVMIGSKLFVANAGDSRAVLARRSPSGGVIALDLSEDQKPDTPAEMARIKKKKGFVSPPEEEWGGPARVWLDANMTLPGLAMARSIGDHLVTSIGVIAEPEVMEHELGRDDLFLIMASDGVWEFISSDEAVAICAPIVAQAGATEACTKLIERAAAKWREEEGDYRDDITAIVCKFPCLQQRPA